MLRLVVFFAAAFALTGLLAQLPVVGAIFRIPILGFWFAAIVLSILLTRGAAAIDDKRRVRAMERQLGAVDTPAAKGKLGSFILQQGRARRALPLLEAAHSGEPEWSEWAYRLGEARLATGDAQGARQALERLVARDEEHAFGRGMRLAARAAARMGDGDGALALLDRHDRNHGPGPESAFERGRILKGLGRRDEARAEFSRVSKLADEAGRFTKERYLGLRLKALFARVF